MMWYTHIVFGYLFWVLGIKYLNLPNSLWLIPVILILSLFPDLDAEHSKLGSKLPWLQWIVNKFFGHRGFFHSLWMVVIITLGPYFLLKKFGWNTSYAFLLGVAYLSHLGADSLTVGGVRPFYPFFQKFKFKGFIKTGGFLECIIFILTILFTAYLTLKLGVFGITLNMIL